MRIMGKNGTDKDVALTFDLLHVAFSQGRMKCHPRCDVPLPEIGNARVITSFDVCQQPAELTIRIIHEVRSTCTFLARDPTVDSRNIGTEHWPMKLNVQFLETKPDEYAVKACVITERLNAVTCFMNSTYTMEDTGTCGGGGHSASVPLSLVALSAMLALLAVVGALGVVFLLHRLFLRFCNEEGRSRRCHKQSQLSALLPSSNGRMEDDRLTVIEEEREDLPSPSEETKGIFFPAFSDPQPVHVVVCDQRPFMHSFKPPPEPV